MFCRWNWPVSIGSQGSKKVAEQLAQEALALCVA